MKNATTIDEYIALYPKDVQVLLEKLRKTIRDVVPEATEAISYGIPTFKLNGKNLVHFGGYAKHIGFYPAPKGIEAFKEELSVYEGGKGTVQFPLDKPIPYDLVKKIVAFRASENLAKK
jgi:uncharacterized protein YdhG (YjbR/CyaY superfamily)